MPSEKLLDLRSDGYQPRTVTDQLIEWRHGARILRCVAHYWRIFATCVRRHTTGAKSSISLSPASGIAVALPARAKARTACDCSSRLRSPSGRKAGEQAKEDANEEAHANHRVSCLEYSGRGSRRQFASWSTKEVHLEAI
jgi:hypothetical protein